MLFSSMKNVQELLKNKMVLIAAGVVVLILVLGLVLFMVLGKGSGANNQTANAQPTEVPVLTLQPSDIGLAFAPDASLQKGTMTISKTSDITSVDYQLTYTAIVTGQPVARGTIGHVDVKNPGQTITQSMVFGTCSDVCHYDTGITDVKLIVKVTKTNSNIYQVELPVTLPASK
jgi:hypothetical protein